ncbi:MAG: membrane protein insertase YidC [Crocinitomicaceae bacterium]|nr:membrane protein insertase YidC [Flavobacteriales bacterium]NQZ36853.1 membrane protein insertase YidC [Crocinitomicaceae bacterium]
MDRNTIIGLVLIGLTLTTFAIFNQPSEEEMKAAQVKAKQEQVKADQKKKDTQKKKKEAKAKVDADTIEMTANWTPKLDEDDQFLKDSLGSFIYQDTLGNDTLIAATSKMIPANLRVVKTATQGEIITLETDKLIIDFDTKGAQIAQVRLKEFQSFDNFVKEDDKINPLVLFQRGDASQGLTFPMGNKNVNTSKEIFEVKSQSESKIVFELKKGDKGSIEFVYQLKNNAYDLDFDINIKGLSGQVTPKNVIYNWELAYRRTERLMSEQRRVSTVCYNYEEEGFSYLSEMSSDDEKAEDDIDWICYKQSYFSSILRPENSFAKEGSSFKVKIYEEGDDRDSTHLKQYISEMNLNLKNVDNASVSMNWFFGPNDYKVLTSYDEDYDQILNYGWGIFRWINIYAVQPVFNALNSTGMAIGLAILLLTLLIKSALMPIQWKMYTSSAKMRILKPEIEEITKKYPNKDDSMKKQMETMSLYRESGASPLAGCVPMLIQMPILLAVFRFFPATFDLRQKSFLWAEDLSSFDSIATLPWSIPVYGDHVSLFTLLMAVTTLIYTHINSSNMSAQTQPGMPNMKVIMYFFPVMMIFFFNNYSSGLSYYYFISTLMSIVIMLLIKKFFVDEDKIKAKMAERKAIAASGGSKKGGKSKFQERLQKMQEAQRTQIKNKKK